MITENFPTFDESNKCTDPIQFNYPQQGGKKKKEKKKTTLKCITSKVVKVLNEAKELIFI